MRAWRFYAFGDMRLDEVELEDCPPDHVLVEPMVVQPSVTEAQLAFGIPTLAYENIKSRLQTDAPLQLFGHEFCARILEVGSQVPGYEPGDRVAARAKLPCGECSMCTTGRGNDCRLGPIIGFQLPGCFAERALLPAVSLVKVTTGSPTARRRLCSLCPTASPGSRRRRSSPGMRWRFLARAVWG